MCYDAKEVIGVNMKTLAELAGVSVSTVSKAFSNSPEVSKAKKEEIYKLARQHGCYEKYCKRTFEGAVIGVLCLEYKSAHYSQQLSFLEKEIRKRGGVMLAACNDFDNDRTLQLLKYFAEGIKVDGIIALMRVPETVEVSVPMVVYGANKAFDCVEVSDEAAMCDAVRLLKAYGHTDIAYIGEKHAHTRLKKFEEAMAQNGLEVKKEFIFCGTERFEMAGYRAMEKLLAMPNRPTAVCTAYDSIAFGASKCISDRGLKVPEDISLIGSNNNAGLPYLNVPLTSITEYNEDLCEIFVALLYERMQSPGKPRTVKLVKELVIRESVGKAKRQKDA